MELSPVWKNCTITSISDQLLWKLGYFRIQIVPNIVHYAFGSFSLGWISLIRIGPESIFRLESIHINVTILFELCVEFFPQFFMVLFGEISEGISNSLSLLFFIEQWISFGGMWQILQPVFLSFQWKVSFWNGLGEINLNDLSHFVDLFDGHWKYLIFIFLIKNVINLK